MSIEFPQTVPSKFPFGKFKGKPFFDAVYTDDSAYWAWVLLQPNLWRRYPDSLYAIWRLKGRRAIFDRALGEAANRGGFPSR